MVRPISRDEFTAALSRQGGSLNVDAMPQSLRDTFHANGITDDDLRTIAGQDHIIRGTEEFRALFARIDRVDTDGRTSTITTADVHGAPTRSGQVYNAVRAEIDNNRTCAQAEGGQRWAGDATLARVAEGTRTLSVGSSGEHVRRIQQALIDIGALSPSHGVTGRYDADTAAAVRRFQRE